MPSPAEILAGARTIANAWRSVAVVWHVLLGAMLCALAAGWRPSNAAAGLLLVLPSISVSVMAWRGGNPFNGSMFALLAIVLAVVAVRLRDESVHIGRLSRSGAGGLLIAFGWAYPHFLETASPMPYLYAAPLGLIPCPTLTMTVGMTLLLDLLGSRAWSLVLAAAALFYGSFGVMRLGVLIDVVLLAGGVWLGAAAVRNRDV